MDQKSDIAAKVEEALRKMSIAELQLLASQIERHTQQPDNENDSSICYGRFVSRRCLRLKHE